MKPPETVDVDTTTVACDGNGPALGHPRVYLTLAGGKVDCPYCGRQFRLKAGTAAEAAH
ncbi:MAG: zinc-finger domain-containing protein [Rhodospirillales bacterium]